MTSHEKGSISINTENILPIIKRWLYSERDIFLRELVANAADAIHKLEKLQLMGEADKSLAAGEIRITVNKEAKTVTIADNGVGMTADEIKRYINQVAFSGAQDFIGKYQDKADSEQIIGHFGLGFYSSFMVASPVEIDTLSYQGGATAAHWQSTGEGEFEIKEGTRTQVGTTITLHISKDAEDLLEVGKIKTIAQRYCGFLKYPVFVNDEQVSNPKPLWTLSPTELKDDDYKALYNQLFMFGTEPLFWIHLNVDYPFKLRGVLYFPKLSHELDASQGQVKLFCNQVYVEDNCKELIPDYLTLLKGVIDCPDLPLNVSRSALQKDDKVQRISQHITKKVADKLTGMFNVEREKYEEYWEDISPFIKYAMLRDSAFLDRMKDVVLYKTTSADPKQKFLTLDEYLTAFKDKTADKIIYVSNPSAQAGLVKMLADTGVGAIIASRIIDQHFLPYIEMHTNNKYAFQRIDAGVVSHLVDGDAAAAKEIVDPKDNKTGSERLADLFKKHVPGSEKLKVKVENLKGTNVPAIFLLDENMRRLDEMAATGHLGAFKPDLADAKTLVVNRNSTAIKNLLALAGGIGREEEVGLMVQQIHDLAALQQGQVQPELMTAFLERSTEILSRLGQTSAQPVG